MNSELRCDGCGMPSEIASRTGMHLELQKDGRVLCSVCCEVMPMIQDAMKDHEVRKAKDFAAHIEANASMFELSAPTVMFATGQIFIESVLQIANNDKKLAIKAIEKYIDELIAVVDKMREEVNKKEEVKHE